METTDLEVQNLDPNTVNNLNRAKYLLAVMKEHVASQTTRINDIEFVAGKIIGAWSEKLFASKKTLDDLLQAGKVTEDTYNAILGTIAEVGANMSYIAENGLSDATINSFFPPENNVPPASDTLGKKLTEPVAASQVNVDEVNNAVVITDVPETPSLAETATTSEPNLDDGPTEATEAAVSQEP